MSVPHGFNNSTLYCTNVDFRGVTPVVDQMVADGQLLIGSSVAPQIRAGLITSTDSSVTISVGHGTIDLSATGALHLTGDSGTIIGSALTVYADVAALNCGSTVSFVNSGSTSTFNLSDSTNNTIVGKGAGNSSSTGNNNCIMGNNSFISAGSSSYCSGIGYGILAAATSVQNASAVGLGALGAAISSHDCTAMGFLSLNGTSRDNQNSAFGSYSLPVLNGGTAAINNCAFGFQSGLLLGNAHHNLFLGTGSGSNYTSGNSNISLNSAGVNGEGNTLRIGQSTGTGNYQLTRAYVAGVAASTLTAGSPTPHLMLIDSSNDQVVSPTPVAANTASTAFGSLAVGTALQNTSNYPILVNVSMVMSAATGAVILVGVDSTNTPTAQAVTASFSGAATESFSFVVPAKFYAKVTTTGTITVTTITTLATQIG